MHHFSMGLWLLGLAFVISVLGSVVGLACTRQSAKAATGGARMMWLAMAAVSIGGVGIWLMHFIAMLGFSVPESALRYSLGWTVVSALLAIVAVFVGLITIGRSLHWGRLLLGGLITGLAVNVMHYTGMAAIRIQGTIDYDPTLVAVSVVIAVIAGTAALYFTLVLDSVPLRIGAAIIMGIAVTGMHFTGMAAARVHVDPSAPVPTGADVFSFLFPVFVFGMVALAIPIIAVLTAQTADAAEEDALEYEFHGCDGHDPDLTDVARSSDEAGIPPHLRSSGRV